MAEVSFEVVSMVAIGDEHVEIMASGDGDDNLTILTSNKEYAKAQYIGSGIKLVAWLSANERDNDPLYHALKLTFPPFGENASCAPVEPKLSATTAEIEQSSLSDANAKLAEQNAALLQRIERQKQTIITCGLEKTDLYSELAKANATIEKLTKERDVYIRQLDKVAAILE